MVRLADPLAAGLLQYLAQQHVALPQNVQIICIILFGLYVLYCIVLLCMQLWVYACTAVEPKKIAYHLRLNMQGLREPVQLGDSNHSTALQHNILVCSQLLLRSCSPCMQAWQYSAQKAQHKQHGQAYDN